MNEGNDWREWRLHILKELERFNEYHERFESRIETLHAEVAHLKAHARIWGAIAGVVPTSAALLIQYLIDKKGS